MLILSAGLEPDAQRLLERAEASNGWLTLAEKIRMSRLRAAPRKIAGPQGDELAESLVEENGACVHSFWKEANGTEDNVLLPHVVLKITTGNGNQLSVPPSLSDGAALGVWDKIASSIRLRQAQAQAGWRHRAGASGKLATASPDLALKELACCAMI